MKARIVVAAHKPYKMPRDAIYLPLHVGRAGKKDIGFTGDDTGDNISVLNPMYCELTGLYWAWKNLSADHIGLAHYRRHFKGRQKGRNAFDRVLTGEELHSLLQKAKIVLPKKRRYYIETLYSHYAHTHAKEHLDVTRQILSERYPEYLGAFDAVMRRRSAHIFNMLVMKREILNDYCAWLFDILGELVRRIEDTGYSSFDKRYPGRVSECLLDVWLVKNHQVYVEVPFLYMEPVDWFKKACGFLKAKFLREKYKGG